MKNCGIPQRDSQTKNRGNVDLTLIDTTLIAFDKSIRQLLETSQTMALGREPWISGNRMRLSVRIPTPDTKRIICGEILLINEKRVKRKTKNGPIFLQNTGSRVCGQLYMWRGHDLRHL